MLVVFIALLAGPLVAGKYLKFNSIPLDLLQPTGLNHNDTTNSQTGTAIAGGAAETAAATTAAAAARRFMAY